MNDMVYQMPRIFPDSSVKNRVICINGVGAQKDFSTLIVSIIPNLHTLQTGQCFPLYLYEANDTPTEQSPQNGLFDEAKHSQHPKRIYTPRCHYRRRLKPLFNRLPKPNHHQKKTYFITSTGLLHSEDYKTKYADNLTKELPRIPCVKQTTDFWAFSKAGRDLAELHINYETVKPYPVTFDEGKLSIDMLSPEDFRVTQMKFAKKATKPSLSITQKSP